MSDSVFSKIINAVKPRTTTYYSSPKAKKMTEYYERQPTTPGVNTIPSSAPANKYAFSENMPIYSRPSVEQARAAAQKVFEGYSKNVGYQSPLLNHVDTFGQVASDYGINEYLLPLLSIAESGALKPGSRGVSANNPFSTIVDGRFWQYPDIPTAIRYYASGIAGPTTGPAGGGIGRYSAFRNLGPKATLRDFIYTQNPEDNPEGEIALMIRLAQQLGLQ